MARRVVFLATVLALLAPAAAHAGRGMFVGVDDDKLKWLSRPNGIVGADRDLDIGTIRITVPWTRGEVRPNLLAQIYMSRAAKAIALGQHVVVAVYGRPSDAPTDAVSRNEYAGFVRHVLARIPQLSGVVIWNEANSPRFWPSRSGAWGYEALLAKCWDVLHRTLRHPVNVIDSTGAHYDPARFIRELGAAYRDSGRIRPIVDTFGHNPYPESSAESPWATHEGTGSLGEGDYAALLQALTDAFLFTAQPLPSAQRPTLWYLEDGFQTAVPPSLAPLYRGRENDLWVIPAVAPSPPDQATQLREAVELAYCQPAVGAFFNFELIDERRLSGWQSGLMYTDGTRKPSFLAFRNVVLAVAANDIDCSTVLGAPPSPPAAPGH